MKRSSVLESRRKSVSPAVRQKVNLSFQIVNRIHEVLTAKGYKQKDLANMLGKSEAEISKWMRGTHNFTLDTIMNIEEVLNEQILVVYSPRHEVSCAVS
ncbi:MAG: helix-turn-helix transcriptional regulator [Bacteroidales bacterium]|nr:helix-turn-helix transcriptional regulator [Candidatus Minthousia equi]